DFEQEYRSLLFTGGGGQNWTGNRGCDPGRAGRCGYDGNAILQTSKIIMYPEDYRYTKEHEWVHVQGDTGTVGITDHAQHELGDIVYVDFKYGREILKPGQSVEQGKAIGSVESVKAVSDIYCPVSGEIVEINQSLADAPEKLNSDPHG